MFNPLTGQRLERHANAKVVGRYKSPEQMVFMQLPGWMVGSGAIFLHYLKVGLKGVLVSEDPCVIVFQSNGKEAFTLHQTDEGRA